MASFKIGVKGVDSVLKKFNVATSAKKAADVERVTETYTRKMANESAAVAPVDTGVLRNSITASPQRVEGKRGVWQWGSNLEYARRQEYENASRKGFIRNTVWANREPYIEAIRKKVTEGVK